MKAKYTQQDNFILKDQELINLKLLFLIIKMNLVRVKLYSIFQKIILHIK